MAQVINVKMVMDTVCPWCYIGKHRLEKAIYQFKLIKPNVEFNIQYLPYQLSPETKKAVNKLEHYNKKFGQERFKEMSKRILEVTEPLGIKVNYGGVISNTFDSHRLIWWSNQFNKQPQVVEELCVLYFDENKDIGDHDALATAAEKAGLDKQKTLDFLKSVEGTSQVQALLSDNNVNEITGVPFYIFNEKFAIPGAQESETFISVFNHVLKN